MQKILRVLILIAMLITAYLLVLAWQKDYVNVPTTATDVAVPTVSTNTAGTDIPTSSGINDIPAATAADSPDLHADLAKTNSVTHPLINVSTDLYQIKIDPVGGDVVYVALRDFDATLHSKTPFVLLENQKNRTYVAQSGLIGADGIDTAAGRAKYSYPSDNYVMSANDAKIEVPLTFKKDGVTITKTFTFTKGKYPIVVNYNINNGSTQPWTGQMFAQLKRDGSKDPGMSDKGALSMATYLGGAWGTPEDDYTKLKFKDFNDGKLKASSKDGWVGVVQHYFVSAWTPENFTGNFFAREVGGDYFIGMNSQPIAVPAHQQMDIAATLYTGPKDQTALLEVAPGLNKTVDYGLLWPISKILFAILEGIHNILGNWGWSIIALTVLVKIALMWFSNKSYYSMAKMRAIAPRLQALKEEHGDDRMKMSQSMMALYKEEKVNPLAGCLPILLQMPIFLALYWVLVESVELRHAEWILWIKDLSSMDPFFILPILMGGSMFAMQLFSPQPTDPMQAKVMRFLPIIFTLFMLFFPAGLVLYWTVNNLFTMAQQYFVNKKVEKEQALKPSRVLD